MTKENSATRLQRLRADIAHHDELYYRASRPEIADSKCLAAR